MKAYKSQFSISSHAESYLPSGVSDTDIVTFEQLSRSYKRKAIIRLFLVFERMNGTGGIYTSIAPKRIVSFFWLCYLRHKNIKNPLKLKFIEAYDGGCHFKIEV